MSALSRLIALALLMLAVSSLPAAQTAALPYPVAVPNFDLLISILLLGFTTDGKILLPGNITTNLNHITPIGIVAMITPWNDPMLTPARKLWIAWRTWIRGGPPKIRGG